MTKELKVLFVIPRPGKGLVHKDLWPHYGVASLAAYLRQKSIKVSVFDFNTTRSYKKFLNQMKAFKPSLVALTAYSREINSAHKIATNIKSYNPKILTVVGGSHASAIPEVTLKEFPAFDFVISGEGEEPLFSLVTSDYSVDTLKNIPGLSFRNANQIFQNAIRDFIDVDSLPEPAWDIFDLSQYSSKPPLRVSVSRGCSYQCTFCSHSSGNIVRHRSVSSIISEIKSIKFEYGLNFFYFSAETFTYSPKFVESLCIEMKKQQWMSQMTWSCSTRADCLNKKLLHSMHEAGCREISIGIESGSQRVLDSVQKGNQLARTKEVVEEAARIGISIWGNFILGLPDDDRTTINESIQLSLKLKLQFATYTIFTPFPGSELTRMLINSLTPGTIKYDWDQYDTQNSCFVMKRKNISSLELWLLHKYAYARFYFRRNYFMNLLKIFPLSSCTREGLRYLVKFPYRLIKFFYKS